MSIIDPTTGVTLHPNVTVGSELTWREIVTADGCELYDANHHQGEQPVVRTGRVLEIHADPYEDWLLVRLVDDGIEYDTDLPAEWWGGVNQVAALSQA
jgi:hypothetical protein